MFLCKDLHRVLAEHTMYRRDHIVSLRVCPWLGAVDADAWHARKCHSSSSQVNQHQRMVHQLSRNIPKLNGFDKVEEGSLFLAKWDAW